MTMQHHTQANKKPTPQWHTAQRAAKLALLGLATAVLVACGGGDGSTGGENNGGEVLTEKNPNTNIVNATAAELGIAVFQVLEDGKNVPKGYIYEGVLNVSYSGINASQITFEVVSGVVSQLSKNSAQLWTFKINATDLAVGYHPYVIKAKNTITGKESLFEGTVKVVQPVVQQFTLAGEGKDVPISGAETIKFSANALPQAANVTILATPNLGGMSYTIKSDIPLANAGVKISFPSDLTPTAQESTSLLKAVQLGLTQVVNLLINTEKVNLSPYQKDTININATDGPAIVKKGLGSLVATGNIDTYTSGADQLMQRHWDNTDDSFSSDSGFWSVIKDSAGLIANQINLDRHRSWELHSSIMVHPSQIDWSQYEPILFVHGFAPSIGGGEGTWAKFPKLALQSQLPNGKTLMPFEFHWYTTQSFRLAAKDLGDAIAYINLKTGQKVHIVSHSFGGVLTRTFLQGLNKNSESTNNLRNKVASVVSLGSPYSGISQTQKTIGSHTLPMGNFDINAPDHFINLCVSVTCYEVGGAPLASATSTPSMLAQRGLTGDYATAGQLVTKLNETEANLPSLPYYQGIGLIKNLSAYKDGDWLISFAGQRFKTGATADLKDKNKTPLLTEEKVGQAQVTEVILGELPTARPGYANDRNSLPTLRQSGYLHSGITGNMNWFTSDGGSIVNAGLMAAPEKECDLPATCTHAGYLLLKQALGDKFNFSNKLYERQNQLPAGTIALRSGVSLTAEQSQIASSLMNEIKAKGIISGANINWNKLTKAEKIYFWSKMNNFPNNDAVSALLQINADSGSKITEYYASNLNAANNTSAVDGLFGDGALKDWVKVAEAEMKGVIGVLKIAYPYQSMASSISTKTLTARSSDFSKLAKSIKLLTSTNQWLSIATECGFDNPVEYTESLNTLYSGTAVTAGDVETAISLPLNCMATILAKGSDQSQNWGNLISLLTNQYTLEDGTSSEGLALALSVIDAAVSFVPESPKLMYVKGTLDIASAGVSAYTAGKEMAARADKAYLAKFADLDAQSTKWAEQYQSERVQMLLSAKGNYLFTIVREETTPMTSNSTPTVGQSIQLWITNAWASIKQVVWSFSDSVTTYTANVVNGVSETISHTFTTSGTKTITATYKDANDTLGTGKLDVTVTMGTVTTTAEITQVINDNTTPNSFIPKDTTTTDTTPKITGSISAALGVVDAVRVYAGTTLLGTATTTGRDWVLTGGTALVAGTHTLKAVVYNAYSMVEGGNANTWTITVAGVTPTITDLTFTPAAANTAAKITAVFSTDMQAIFATTGAYVPKVGKEGYWPNAHTFVVEFDSFTSGGQIFLVASGFKSVSGQPLAADRVYTFPQGLGGTFKVGAISETGKLFVAPNLANSCTFYATGIWDSTSPYTTGATGIGPITNVPLYYTWNWRLFSAPFMSLVASIGNEGYVYIGDEATINVERNKDIYFIANDGVGAHFDNGGELTVSYSCQ